MSTPTVTETPRRPEPVARDTFIDDFARTRQMTGSAPVGCRGTRA